MQLHFLQTLSHHLVTTIHILSVCTVEVVGTSQPLPHLNFSKVWLPCTAMVLVLNLLVIFPGLDLPHDFIYLTICRDMTHVAIVGRQNEYRN